MRFLCVRQPTRANIFGEEYDLKPLDASLENIQDILATDNFSAAELLSNHPDILSGVSLDRESCAGFPRVIDRLEDIDTPGRILIMRNGGIGDHVLFLPALPVFRTVFPKGSEIWLSTQKEKHPLFWNNGNIDRLLPLPLRLDVVLEADYVIDFSERNDEDKFNHLHLTDYFLDFLGIEYDDTRDKVPSLAWEPCISKKVYRLFEAARKSHLNKPIVLLNWKASNRLRDLPPQKLLFLSKEFPGALFSVAQHSEDSEHADKVVGEHGHDVFNCTPYIKSLVDYITVIANCDAVVTTDTSTGHLAEALGKPNLVIYGPIDSDLRIRYYKKACAVTADYVGKTCQSPCGLSKADGGCGESRLHGTAYSPCLFALPDERLRTAFGAFLERIETQ
jgi:ADP-heptose:LPS heptosyltransferase